MTPESTVSTPSLPGLDRAARRIYDLPYADLTPRLALGVQKALAAEHGTALLQELRLIVIGCICGKHRDGIDFSCGCNRCASQVRAISKAEGRIL